MTVVGASSRVCQILLRVGDNLIVNPELLRACDYRLVVAGSIEQALAAVPDDGVVQDLGRARVPAGPNESTRMGLVRNVAEDDEGGFECALLFHLPVVRAPAEKRPCE